MSKKPGSAGNSPTPGSAGGATGGGGKLVIPKYIHKKGGLDQSGANEKWDEIQKAIAQIYEENASSLSFQTLYTNAYYIVLHKHGDLLYDGVQKTITDYIKGVKEKLLQVNDSEFLGELNKQWDKHRKSILMIRDILMYMDRNYVPQNKKTAVYDLGVKIFGSENMLRSSRILDRLQRLALDIIQRERDGENTPDRFILKNLTVMMLEISKKDVYEPCFEKRFLSDSETYYLKEAMIYFEDSTAPDYLRKVQQRLKEERERAERCFEESTKPKIETVLKTQMIKSFVQKLIEKENTGVLSMLQQWKLDDLRLVYDVLGLVPGGLEPAVELVRTFGTNQGLELVNNADMNEKPLELVEECINLREKYDDMLIRAFSANQGGNVIRDKEFATAVRRAFEDIVNTNDRFPEYLSLYIDSKLKKGKTQVADTEYDIMFERVIALFRHLREKDVFEKYYKNHLAKRLLTSRSASDEAEKNFITKLKGEFGYQFTSKLEGMFQDMKVSKDLMTQFKSWQDLQKSRPDVDISVQVLTTGFWPVPSLNACNLSLNILKTSEEFKRFYLQHHSGRRLTWQYSMGTADIKTAGYQKHYELNVATYQMVILLLFNEVESLSYQEILNTSQIPAAELTRNLLSFCQKTKSYDNILNKSGGIKDIEKTTVFSLNPKFTSKLIKVKINPVILKESKDQVVVTMNKINEDRKWQIDAVIVRIMKARKSEEHKLLVLEVTKQLQSRFMPSPDLVKKRIESLIEREYLERSESSRSRYNYLA